MEGSFYWRNKLKQVRRQKALSNMEIGRIYHKLRWVNVILLTAYLPAMVLAALAGEDLSGRIAGIFLYFMAVIEQINYFHVRLSYETVNGTLLVIEPLKKLLPEPENAPSATDRARARRRIFFMAWCSSLGRRVSGAPV